MPVSEACGGVCSLVSGDKWQPPLTTIIQKRRLTLFSHLVRMDESADARRILTAVPQSEWRRPVGRPYTSWMATYLGTILPWRMLSNWLWISRCSDYWQQAELRTATDGACRIIMMMISEAGLVRLWEAVLMTYQWLPDFSALTLLARSSDWQKYNDGNMSYLVMSSYPVSK